MASISITANDPTGALARVPLLNATINAAIAYLERYVVFKGTLDILIIAEATATGRFAGTGSTSYVGNSNGINIWESSMIAESRNGIDPYPTTPDFTIFIDPQSSYLDRLWWDPNISTDLTGRVPNNFTDAFTVVVHELIHGMGITGWRSPETGLLPADYESVWDSLIVINDNKAMFTGAVTQALLGQPVEVRLGGSQGAFHLGNGPDPDASLIPWVEASNFNSYYYFNGERYTIGRLELAILQDIGWTLKPTTLVDLVNRWDSHITDRHMVGWDTSEQLTGDILNDSIEGRGGNDTIDGGGGTDTAVFSSNLANYALTKSGSSYIVLAKSGTDGTDTITNVESLEFGDKTVNLTIQSIAAAAPQADVHRLEELYVAFFNRVPDADGLAYWLGQMNAGQSLNQIAEAFYNAGVQYSSLTGFSATMSNEDFVNVIYRNVLGRNEGADTEGLNYWSSELASGHATHGSLASAILGSAHTYKGDATWGWVADLLDNKISVANQFAVDWGLNYNTPSESITQGMAIAAAVTPTSTAAAIALIGVSATDMQIA